MKKLGFSVDVARLFTRADMEAYALLPFAHPEADEEDAAPALERPENWSAEATALLGEAAAFAGVPARLKPVEENTVPSWLWRHRTDRKGAGVETSARQIFDRAVGAATYTGWKLGMFADETAARAFFDEARYALAQRFVAFEPRDLAALGLDWAYGTAAEARTSAETAAPLASVDVSNAMIDAVVGGRRDKALQTKWQKITGQRPESAPIHLRFTDVAADWTAVTPPPAALVIDLMACRHNDGSVNTAALRHFARMAVFLADLHGMGEDIAIGLANLASLLMALALPYDSEAGRATAAAISAVVTAEAYAASAEMAALRGVGASFEAEREARLRAMRNHRRSAYGERNDYEKISVLPVPLRLEDCPDLALAAAARSAWDDALQLAQNYGLRHRHVTGLPTSPSLTLFMGSLTQGLEPVRTLTVALPSGDAAQRSAHPSVTEGLARLGYDTAASQMILRHIAGAMTLDKAPAINHAALRAHGFGAAQIERIEQYLPQARHVRFAFTPWVLGEEFCRRTLKIPASAMETMRVDVLGHLGFTEQDVAAANGWCYGHGTARGAHGLRAAHAAVFADAGSISPEAQIRMAAALQSFVTGDVGLRLSLSPDRPAEMIEKLLLAAWRQGVAALDIAYDAAPHSVRKASVGASLALANRKTPRRIKASAFVHAKAPALPIRTAKRRGPTGARATRPAPHIRGAAK